MSNTKNIIDSHVAEKESDTNFIPIFVNALVAAFNNNMQTTPKLDNPVEEFYVKTKLTETLLGLATNLHKTVIRIQIEHANIKKKITGTSCQCCEKYATCTSPCEEVLAQLSEITKSKSHFESINYQEFHKSIQAIHSEDILHAYEPCMHMLSVQQREILSLYHTNGWKQKEIADFCGLSGAAVSKILKKTTEILETYRSNLRNEQAEKARAWLSENEE